MTGERHLLGAGHWSLGIPCRGDRPTAPGRQLIRPDNSVAGQGLKTNNPGGGNSRGPLSPHSHPSPTTSLPATGKAHLAFRSLGVLGALVPEKQHVGLCGLSQLRGGLHWGSGVECRAGSGQDVADL